MLRRFAAALAVALGAVLAVTSPSSATEPEVGSYSTTFTTGTVSTTLEYTVSYAGGFTFQLDKVTKTGPATSRLRALINNSSVAGAGFNGNIATSVPSGTVVWTNGVGGVSWPTRTFTNSLAGPSNNLMLYVVSYSSSPTTSSQFNLADNVPPTPPWSPEGTGYSDDAICSLPVPYDVASESVFQYSIEDLGDHEYKLVMDNVPGIVGGDIPVSYKASVVTPINDHTALPHYVGASNPEWIDGTEFTFFWFPGWGKPYVSLEAYYGQLEGSCISPINYLEAWNGAPQ